MSVTNPQRIQIQNRRKEQEKWRKTKAWRAFVELHAHQPDCECARCHKKHRQVTIKKNGKPRITYLTVNHISRRKYESFEEYITWDDDCEVCCTLCNWMYEKAKKPCPKCGERYIPWFENECNQCYYKEHPVKLQEKKQRIFKNEQFKRDLKKKKNAADRTFRKSLKKLVNTANTPKPIRDWDGRIFPDA